MATIDYTSTALVKTAMGATGSADDAQIAKLVTAASRAIDRKVGGAQATDGYFQSETVTGETGRGATDKDGVVWYYAHKVKVSAVATFEYRYMPQSSWLLANSSALVIEGNAIMAYASAPRGFPYIQVSYTGGLSSTQAGLPEDIIEAATVLAVRYYKEVKAGLGDTIGVAELGQLVYTKTWPSRVLDMLAPYMRRNPIW
jgi:hypothetical protein